MNTSSQHREHPEHQYLVALSDLLVTGNYREGRNGGVASLFGRQMRFDLSKGFPLLTTKRIHFKSIVVELLWFLRGDTNIEFLHDHGVTIWDEWADAEGNLGPVYGKQWRRWEGREGFIDQIANLIEGLRSDPYGRRHVVSAWNPAEIEDMALPPCHCLFQFHVTAPVAGGKPKLSCQLYQRSADMFLGVPFNIASYALLTHLIAREVGTDVGDFVHTLGDYHLYDNHVEQAGEQITRTPRDWPTLVIDAEAWQSIDQLHPDNIRLEGYDPHARIAAPVSK